MRGGGSSGWFAHWTGIWVMDRSSCGSSCWDTCTSLGFLPGYINIPCLQTMFYKAKQLHGISVFKKKKTACKEKVEVSKLTIKQKRRGERWDCSWLWVWQQMFYKNPTRCSQSVSMATESVIIEPRHSPNPPPNKVEADEYKLSPAHHQLFLFSSFLFLFLKVLYKKK